MSCQEIFLFNERKSGQFLSLIFFTGVVKKLMKKLVELWLACFKKYANLLKG
jgi:hypothetical protein